MAIQSEFIKKEIEELPVEMQEKVLKLIHFLKKEFFLQTKKEKRERHCWRWMILLLKQVLLTCRYNMTIISMGFQRNENYIY